MNLRIITFVAAIASSPAAFASDYCADKDTAVDMTIVSVVSDEARYVQYRSALATSQLIPKFGGEVIAVGTPLSATPDMLEGSWPENRHTFIIRWPCEGAARAFWNSPQYRTEIFPLRDGAGNFDVALFPAYLTK